MSKSVNNMAQMCHGFVIEYIPAKSRHPKNILITLFEKVSIFEFNYWVSLLGHSDVHILVIPTYLKPPIFYILMLSGVLLLPH